MYSILNQTKICLKFSVSTMLHLDFLKKMKLNNLIKKNAEIKQFYWISLCSLFKPLQKSL